MDEQFPDYAGVVSGLIGDVRTKAREWAQLLGWSEPMVHANPQVARERVARRVASAVVYPHVARVAARSPAPVGPAHPHARASSTAGAARPTHPTPPPDLVERMARAGAESLRSNLQDTGEFLTHPLDWAEKHLAENSKQGRFAEVLSHAEAGTLANVVVGGAEAVDLAQSHLFPLGVVQAELARRGWIPPMPKLADAAYRATARLRAQAAQHPPTKLWEKAVAAIPSTVAVLAAPEVAVPFLAGAQGVGEAYSRARETGASGPLTDAGVVAQGAWDATAGGLLNRIGSGKALAKALIDVPQAWRPYAQTLAIRIAAKAAAAGGIGAVERGGENVIDKATFDPGRRLDDGVVDGAILSALSGAPFGLRSLPDTEYRPISEYRSLPKILKGSGMQAHHLNQLGVYGKEKITPAQGLAIALRGDAIRELGSEHHVFHSTLDAFFDPYREGGAFFPKKPTNAQYDAALRKSLMTAGVSLKTSNRAADDAARQRRRFGYEDHHEVPHVPRAVGHRRKRK